MEYSVLAILGGDKRYALLASMLAQDGYTVLTAGLDKATDLTQGAVNTDAATAASMAQCVIMPIPPTKDGSTLWTPLGGDTIRLDDQLSSALIDTAVYTGFADRLRAISRGWSELEIYDYGKREEFLLRNAEITAEATVMLAIENMPCALLGSRCLVTGYGRIGRFVSRMLRDMGACVTVAARRESDFALAQSSGLKTTDYAALPLTAHEYDLAVNTADALVLGDNVIRQMHRDAVIIDVASIPGGTDFASAERHSIKAIHALGLPGKYSPASAAKIIKDTVLVMTEEERN